MPNHVHGIVIIDKVDDGRGSNDSIAGNAETQGSVETQNIASLRRGRPEMQLSEIGRAAMIVGFKSLNIFHL